MRNVKSYIVIVIAAFLAWYLGAYLAKKDIQSRMENKAAKNYTEDHL
jgi:hypothetical protein